MEVDLVMADLMGLVIAGELPFPDEAIVGSVKSVRKIADLPFLLFHPPCAICQRVRSNGSRPRHG